MLKLGSLFDGIGTFPLAARMNGIVPVWASEINKNDISITQRHFPEMMHLGSITDLNGGKIPAVDIITFGSPCQNLSTIGNRAGLDGAKSSLFFEAIRIIKEMRCATNGLHPTIACWENVTGAHFSGNRMDFAAVLSAFSNTQIPMPNSGFWAGAGMVRGVTPDIAWRILGAHHHGVAQKRRRIFLVADYRGKRAAEILYQPEDGKQVFPVVAEGGLSVAHGAGSGPVQARWPPGTELYALQGRKMRGAAVTKDKSQFYGSFGHANDAVPTLLTTDIQVLYAHFPTNPQANYLRYVTPLEVERLMGLPEGWTEYGHDGQRIRDSARYFALGNSIVLPCAAYIMSNIKRVLEEPV